ncbi:AraC family transcriptional regulator [Microbacterium foliorum]|uniref:AraC family transcriptional regulator n=1 Tax=Microbacterium foliorum TaxID=104336 RepID=UPI00286CCEBD|nr:AraC family transcriptional regulator [Microbacterium foliorum]
MSGCFVPLACQSFAPSFRGVMDHTQLGPGLSVSRVTTDGTSVERSVRLAARAETDDLHISLQVHSSGHVAQGGRTVPVRPGSVTVYATDKPYRQNYSRPEQRQMIIQVSRHALRLPAGMIDAACERLLVPSSTGGRLLFEYVARASASGDHAGEGVALDLAETMIHGSFASAPLMPKSRGGMWELIRDHIEHNFHSPSLAIDALASQHHVSRRRLYEIFDVSGASPAEWIRERRLRHAEKLLRNGDRALSIARISELSGFADPTTFARAFRRTYTVNPQDFRAIVRHDV